VSAFKRSAARAFKVGPRYAGPVKARCAEYGVRGERVVDHVKKCRRGRPLCRARRLEAGWMVCECPSYPFPHRMTGGRCGDPSRGSWRRRASSAGSRAWGASGGELEENDLAELLWCAGLSPQVTACRRGGEPGEVDLDGGAFLLVERTVVLLCVPDREPFEVRSVEEILDCVR
jgi:hypothetical protein